MDYLAVAIVLVIVINANYTAWLFTKFVTGKYTPNYRNREDESRIEYFRLQLNNNTTLAIITLGLVFILSPISLFDNIISLFTKGKNNE